MSEQYEYQILRVLSTQDGAPEALSAKAADGWRVVQSHLLADGRIALILERPVVRSQPR